MQLALCEPGSVDFVIGLNADIVVGVAIGETQSVDFVVGIALGEPRSAIKYI